MPAGVADAGREPSLSPGCPIVRRKACPLSEWSGGNDPNHNRLKTLAVAEAVLTPREGGH
jgi:hypothetical protein